MSAGPPTGGIEGNRDAYDFLAPPQQPGELGRLGPYRVLKVLGAGGMGVVFLAEDQQLRRKVALKAMLPTLAASESARKRFLREAQTAAAIEHDHIVAIFQVGEDRGVPFLAMPFLKGEPLDVRLKREPPLTLAEIVRIGREVALGLSAAHQEGLIHRDVKPANIFLVSGGVVSGKSSDVSQDHSPLTTHYSPKVKILDFGLARAAAADAQLTQSGAIIGTPAYMAPEQACGQKVDGRCDLFSLGCVLYRLATGELPFKGTDTVSTLMAIATQEPTPPSELNPALPAALEDLILQLLAKKPEERPDSASAVAADLKEIGEDASPTSTLDKKRSPRTRPNKRGKGLTNVFSLFLEGTQVTDAGLEHLKGLAKLTRLGVRQTKVTEEGARKLKNALPKCSVER